MADKLKIRRSALEHHKRVGKELIPPLQQIGPKIDQVFWVRDLLPEFLWIDALVQEYHQSAAVQIFNDFLSAADQFNSRATEILDGTIGTFRFIAEERRQAFVEKVGAKIDFAVVRPLRHVLSLYPECPMGWMAPLPLLDRDASIAAVRSACLRLFADKEPHAGFCRALPLNRLFAHNKVCISSQMEETIQAIQSYPCGDKYCAESFARSVHNMIIMLRAQEDQDTFAWARSFWKRNRMIAPCIYD